MEWFSLITESFSLYKYIFTLNPIIVILNHPLGSNESVTITNRDTFYNRYVTFITYSLPEFINYKFKIMKFKIVHLYSVVKILEFCLFIQNFLNTFRTIYFLYYYLYSRKLKDTRFFVKFSKVLVQYFV